MLFKNGVGRPSNKTLRNRKIFIASAVVVVLLLICTSTYVFFNRDVEGSSKNATSGRIQFYSYVYKNSKNKNSSFQLASGCPVGFFHTSDDYCAKTTSSSKSYSVFRYNNGIDYMYVKRYCSDNGYSSYKNVKYSFPYLRFTCQNIIKVKASELVVPYYYQRNYRDYSSACGGGNLSGKGCMPTSAAIVFSALSGEEKTPVWFNEYYKKLLNGCSNSNCKVSNFQVCTYDYKNNNPSYYAEALELYASNNGYQYETRSASTKAKISSEAKYLDEKLKTGKCMGIVALRTKSEGCKGSYCYSVGHFVVMSGNSTSGKVYILDPYDNNYVFVEESASNIISYAQGQKYRIFCKK